MRTLTLAEVLRWGHGVERPFSKALARVVEDDAGCWSGEESSCREP